MFPTRHDLTYFFSAFWHHSTGLAWIIALVFVYALVAGLRGRNVQATAMLGISGFFAMLLGFVEAFL